jgi:tRNA (mo5U34)-methyltransferase
VVNADSLRKKIAESGFWYQNIELAPGIWTNPTDPKAYNPRERWGIIEPYIPGDLSGKTVLDLGCNAGFFAVRMKQRGAKRVVAVDVAPWVRRQIELVAEVFGVDVEVHISDVHEFCLETRETFDYVFFLGLLYHLRHPLLVLDRISCLLRERLFVQTPIVGREPDGSLKLKDDYPSSETDVFEHPDFPKLFFIEKKFNGDLSNWWFPNENCLQAMLRSSGFRRISRIGHDTFMCDPPHTPLFDGTSYNYVLGEKMLQRETEANE